MKISVNLPLAALITFTLISLAPMSRAQENSSEPEEPKTSESQPPTPTFSDIENNVYQSQINSAAELKIVAGFSDGTFRPTEPVSREQAVSIIVDAYSTVTPVNLDAKPTRAVRPFLDVPDSRWSAKKLKWFQWNVIPQGTPTGNFRPTDSITRAELVEFLRRAAQAIKVELGFSSVLHPTRAVENFSDVSGYNKQLTQQMSAYCRVAAPLNEKGNQFAPNRPAQRDYTVAAIVRMINCVKGDRQ